MTHNNMFQREFISIFRIAETVHYQLDNKGPYCRRRQHWSLIDYPTTTNDRFISFEKGIPTHKTEHLLPQVHNDFREIL